MGLQNPSKNTCVLVLRVKIHWEALPEIIEKPIGLSAGEGETRSVGLPPLDAPHFLAPPFWALLPGSFLLDPGTFLSSLKTQNT